MSSKQAGVWASVALSLAFHAPLAAQSLAFTHVTIVDPVAPTTRDMTVVVRDGRIVTIGPTRTTTIPRGISVTNATGKFLAPGLWDMHVHLGLEGGAWALGQYVSHGITGIRDMGTKFEPVDSLRRAVMAGRLVGPRMLLTGPMIENAEAIRGILAKASREDSTRELRDRVEVMSPSRGTAVVDSLLRLGVDFIKVRNFADTNVYWAIANAARRGGRALVAHPPLGIDPLALADSGQRTIEHWYYPGNLTQLPADQYRRIIDAYVRRGTAFDATLLAWRQHRMIVDTLERVLATALADPRAREVPASLVNHWREELNDRRTEQNGKPATAEQLGGWNRALSDYATELGRMASAGVRVLAGSDLPFAHYPGEGLQSELCRLVVETGMSPRQALAAATITPAEVLGMQDSLGTVAVGRVADLILLGADPLRRIANIRSVEAVYRGGAVVWHGTPAAISPRECTP